MSGGGRFDAARVEKVKAVLPLHRHPDGRANLNAIATATGIPRATLQNMVPAIEAGRADIQIQDQFSTYLEIHAPPKPRIRVQAVTSEPRDEPIYTVVAIGDHHDKPGRDKTRALWIGRHCAERRPHAVVSIGDWASLDSLSAHELPGSRDDAARPAFHEELESLDESLGLFHRDFPIGSLPVFQVHGNHEHRAVRVANKQPKQCGDLPIRLDQVFARYRWHTRPFGEFLDLYGVDFVHVPLSIMGREIGGELAERTIGLKSLRSVVMGHTHVHTNLPIRKVGQNRKIRVVNLGTSMPYGVVEKYNGLAMTGWDYGICELRIQGGVILSCKHIDMLELEERYGD